MDYTLTQSKTWPLWLWLIILSLLASIAYLPWLGTLPLYLEEPRRALIAANMLHSGDYLVPIHAGKIYLGKPPLFNWLIAIFSLPSNTVNAWSARLPSIVSLWLLTLFLVSTAWQKIGKRVAIFWGCAILFSPEILLKGRIGEVDIVFMCLVTAALWSWWLRDQANLRGLQLWLVPLLFAMLAFLTKREPALVFFYLTIGSYLLLHRRERELLSITHWSALLLAMIPVLAWLLAVAMQVGWLALWNSMWHEVLLRGAKTTWDRYWTHVLIYPFQIFSVSAPFSLFLLALISKELRYSVWNRHKNILQFAMIAVLANLPIYWFKGSLAIRYFLPMFPFLLMVSALSYDALLSSHKFINHRWPRVLLPALVILMLLLRSLEFLIYLPIKAQYLANTQNAPVIIKDIVKQLPINRPLFVSERIPSAIWFYAPLNLIQLLNENAKLAKGDLILQHNALNTQDSSHVKIKTYRYENDIMTLEKVMK